jgi:uncharacterized protein
MHIPLFPLHTVLYPDGPLPLRVFEPRYLDMISACLRDEIPFGVVQIREGSEIGPANVWNVGTLARINDWYQGSDGILGITALGTDRFELASSDYDGRGLLHGDAKLLPAAAYQELPEEYLPMVQILDGVLDDLGRLYEQLPRRYDDAVWVGYRFAEILPFDAEQKQACLEMDDSLERLRLIRDVLRDVRGVELA